ncbi:hypothetical protein Afe04nite_38900 [Asanoa ferruginea]|nr:hypothetical protein Afe04nite_38900 [Asanoa ferruginea]
MEHTVIPAPMGSFARRRPSSGRRSTAPVGRPVTVDPPRLDDRMVGFIRRQEMVFVSVAGGPRTSRSGPSGFLRVPSRRLLSWPEFGHSRPSVAGQVRLLFLDLFAERTGLHVTGRASVVPYGPLQLCGSSSVSSPGPRPEFWVRVRVDQAWFADQGPLA